MKRSILLLPMPALLLAVVVVIQVAAPGTAASTCPLPPPAEAAISASPPVLPAGVAETSAVEAPVAAPAGALAPTPPEVTPDVTAAPTPRDEARSLLLLLESAAAADTPILPKVEIEEASRLLSRCPETESVFVAAMETGSRALRLFLRHVAYGVEDSRLRRRLVAELKRTDPTRRRLEEILGDRERILAALSDRGDPTLRKALVSRIGAPLLADAEVLGELRLIAESDSDPGVRSRALVRLARLGDAAVTRSLLETLADAGGNIADRATIAQAYAFSNCDEAIPIFIDLVERGAPAHVLRLCALGLKRAGDEPRAVDALFCLLLDGTADAIARRNAATALSGISLRTPESKRTDLHLRVADALQRLSQETGSAEVLVFAMGEFSRSHRQVFDQDIVSIVDAKGTDEFLQLAAENPDVKRILEAR